jgi:hypothetical protein
LKRINLSVNIEVGVSGRILTRKWFDKTRPPVLSGGL